MTSQLRPMAPDSQRRREPLKPQGRLSAHPGGMMPRTVSLAAAEKPGAVGLRGEPKGARAGRGRRASWLGGVATPQTTEGRGEGRVPGPRRQTPLEGCTPFLV